jgi:hypothetical protein
MTAPYREFTTCTPNAGYVPWALYVGPAVLAFVGFDIVLFVAMSPWCGAIGAVLAAAASGIVFCNWWLSVRLVCLGGQRSVAAMLHSVEPAKAKSFPDYVDSDYSINLLLYPGYPGITQADAEALSPYGGLMADTGLGHGFAGYSPVAPGTITQTAVLHAEFEGPGMADFRDFLVAGYVLAFVGLFACVALPPPLGIIVGAILALLALLLALIGLIVGGNDTADPADVTGTPSVLHTNDPNSGVGADLLYVTGRWVYDSLHEGWNEIHAIHACAVMGTWNGAWPIDSVDRVRRFDDAIDDAYSVGTRDRQDHPQQQWEIHPLVDGCGRYPKAKPSQPG